jgi:hypothetical protein
LRTGLYSWRLYVANQLWRDAAQLTRSIKRRPCCLVVTKTFDHSQRTRQPAWRAGFHNGLPEALQFFQTEKSIESVEINAFQTLQLASDENLHPADDMFTLQPANRLDTFNRASSSQCLELLGQSADSLS